MRPSFTASPREALVAVDLLERGYRVFTGPERPGAGLRLLAVSREGRETPIVIQPCDPIPDPGPLHEGGERVHRAALLDGGTVRYDPPLEGDG